MKIPVIDFRFLSLFSFFAQNVYCLQQINFGWRTYLVHINYNWTSLQLKLITLGSSFGIYRVILLHCNINQHYLLELQLFHARTRLKHNVLLPPLIVRHNDLITSSWPWPWPCWNRKWQYEISIFVEICQ